MTLHYKIFSKHGARVINNKTDENDCFRDKMSKVWPNLCGQDFAVIMFLYYSKFNTLLMEMLCFITQKCHYGRNWFYITWAPGKITIVKMIC